MTNTTGEAVTLDQFPTKAAGMPDFAAQDIFTAMAANHEPKNGLNFGMNTKLDTGSAPEVI